MAVSAETYSIFITRKFCVCCYLHCHSCNVLSFATVKLRMHEMKTNIHNMWKVTKKNAFLMFFCSSDYTNTHLYVKMPYSIINLTADDIRFELQGLSRRHNLSSKHITGFCTSAVGVSVLLGCHASSLDYWRPTFRDKNVVTSLRVISFIKSEVSDTENTKLSRNVGHK